MIVAQRVMAPEEALQLWRDTPVPEVAPTVFASPTPTTIVVDDETVMLVAKMDPTQRFRLRQALRSFPVTGGVFRGAGVRSRSQVFGFLARNLVLQRSSCRMAEAANRCPDAHAAICGFAADWATMLRDALPDQYETNAAAVADVLPEWRLPGGLWTSGVVNQTAMLPYHRDRNNFDVWSVMPTIRRGVRGGHLHFPELALANGDPFCLDCGDGDVVFFNGQRLMHGVTPMRRTMTDGYRYSCVYYPVRKMRSCLSAEAELARARQSRTANEETLVERQRKAGILGGGDE